MDSQVKTLLSPATRRRAPLVVPTFFLFFAFIIQTGYTSAVVAESLRPGEIHVEEYFFEDSCALIDGEAQLREIGWEIAFWEAEFAFIFSEFEALMIQSDLENEEFDDIAESTSEIFLSEESSRAFETEVSLFVSATPKLGKFKAGPIRIAKCRELQKSQDAIQSLIDRIFQDIETLEQRISSHQKALKALQASKARESKGRMAPCTTYDALIAAEQAIIEQLLSERETLNSIIQDSLKPKKKQIWTKYNDLQCPDALSSGIILLPLRE